MINADAGHQWTFTRDGALMVTAGLEVSWPGVAQSWAMFHEGADDPRWLVQEWKDWLDVVMPQYNLRQLRHFAFDIQAVRLAELVGYELECVWKDAGPESEDVFIMVYHRRN